MTHRIVMLATSYPRFRGDSVGSFMEPIAQGIAARGHEVHLVAPWHPKWDRPKTESGVHFHLFHYAPMASLNTFGYAEGLKADVSLRASAIAVAPLAMVAGWFKALRVAQKKGATIVHAHWVIPGGVMGAAAAGRRALVISLHGSDVFVAERHAVARAAARRAFAQARWVTACSDDLRARAQAIGAKPDASSVVPYGVDSNLFKPDPQARAAFRVSRGLPPDVPIVAAVGRLVKKKGFEYLIDAIAILKSAYPEMRLVIAGEGDLFDSLRQRAADRGVAGMVEFAGAVVHHQVPALLAAADVCVVPSVHDDAGNVDGLPNTVLEMMASGTPLVATRAGGIAAVAAEGETALLVGERDPSAVAEAIDRILCDRSRAAAMGVHARDVVCRHYGWDRVARDFEAIYDRC